MRLLLDGDEANNNGNWQWISSVGVDPAPVTAGSTTRCSSSSATIPTGEYVRRWVPELEDVPLEQARDAVGGGPRGPDRRPRRRAPPHARRLRRRPLLSSAASARSRSSPRAVHARLRRALHRGLAAREGPVGDDEVRLHFLVDDWSGPAPSSCARTTPRQRDRRGRQRGARDRAGRADRLARPRRHRLRRDRRPDRAGAAAASGYLRRCSSTRPTRPRPGRSSPPAPARQAVKLRDALGETDSRARRAARPGARVCLEQDPAPARHRPGGAGGQARPRAAARAGPERGLHALRSCRASARSMRA